MAGLILPFSGVEPAISETAFVADTATIIGDVVVGERSGLWFGVVVRGDLNSIRIGCNTNLQDGTIVHVNHDRYGDGGDPTTIGDNVTIGHLALIHACTIGDGAFIGMRAVVMDKAVVETDAMVAAGAVVTPGKVVRSGQLWAGTPARHVRDLRADEIADFSYNASHYAALAEAYLAQRVARPVGSD
ncbi:MAG: gamma carbonic anhydrase family protein [Alphaproteobacteria bacterium]|nr:gamma carbonic anhydrase family protein [Alphaproteobacteria bacterium]